jgi:hypothetical protein
MAFPSSIRNQDAVSNFLFTAWKLNWSWFPCRFPAAGIHQRLPKHRHWSEPFEQQEMGSWPTKAGTVMSFTTHEMTVTVGSLCKKIPKLPGGTLTKNFCSRALSIVVRLSLL